MLVGRARREEFYELQDEETRQRWDRYWFVAGDREPLRPRAANA